LTRWARAIEIKKATKYNPGDTFIDHFVDTARKAALTKELEKRRKRRKRDSPRKPTAVEPAVGMYAGQQAPINNYYFAPGQHQMGMPFGIPSMMPHAGGFGVFGPPPGAGLAQIPSSPVHCEDEDEDRLLEEYFRWLIGRRPAKRQALEDTVAELQQHSVTFGQLKDIPEKIWSEVGVEWGLKDSIIRLRKEFLRFRLRSARKTSPSSQSMSKKPIDVSSTSTESGSDEVGELKLS